MTDIPQMRSWTTREGISMKGLPRPDGRFLIRLPEDHPEAWGSLTALATASIGGSLLVNRRGEQSTAQERSLRAAGFLPGRIETEWRIPVHPLTELLSRSPHEFVPVTELDSNAVAELDNIIRSDIPGTENWQGTAEELQETLSDPEFDPKLYLVARHPETGSLDGLVRVWNRSPAPRLGCLGVTRPWRRTSLPLGLMQAVASRLHARGTTHIVTETDDTNSASYLLAANHGGVKTGTLVEWEHLP